MTITEFTFPHHNIHKESQETDLPTELFKFYLFLFIENN